VLAVDAGVADVRRGLHDDLAVVRRVGQRLLVPGHAGGEDRLAERLPHAAVRLAAERPPVLQDEHRLTPHRTAFPSSTAATPGRSARRASSTGPTPTRLPRPRPPGSPGRCTPGRSGSGPAPPAARSRRRRAGAAASRWSAGPTARGACR